MILGRLDHFAHAFFIADIAGIDPQTGSARFGSFDGAFIVEMDVGHDRHRAFARRSSFKRRGRGLVRCRNPHDIRPSIGGACT